MVYVCACGAIISLFTDIHVYVVMVLRILHVMFRFRGLVSRFGLYDVSWLSYAGDCYAVGLFKDFLI